MASLIVLQGGPKNRRIKLETGSEFTIGRVEPCDIFIPSQAASKRHAKIVRVGDAYSIVDLNSKNKTYLNDQKLEPNQPVPLHDNDKIKICNWVFSFRQQPSPTPIVVREDSDDSDSTVHASVDRDSQQRAVEAQSGEKLHALLEIGKALGRTLKEDELLALIADTLFDLFKKADRCFVIFPDEASGKLVSRLTRTRKTDTDASASFSKTIVQQVLDSGKALLYDDVQRSGGAAAQANSVSESKIRSVMCAPLPGPEGTVSGLIALDGQDRQKTFTQDDLTLLIGVANQAALALENAQLHQLAVKAAVHRQDMQNAWNVQRSLLPDSAPQVAGYHFFAYYQPAQNVGGDYYDFIPLAESRHGILVGDVAGKGMAAALLMAKLSAQAVYCVLSSPDIGQAIARLNEQLLWAGMVSKFVTLAAGVLDPVRHRVSFVNAGHQSPLVFRKQTNSLEPAVPQAKSGYPLGMIEGAQYEFVQIDLNPGDAVLIFTDGVTEAYSPKNELFGLERVRRAVLDNPGGDQEFFSPEPIGQRVIEAVQRFLGGEEQNDDIALVCFGRLSGATQEAADGQILTAAGALTQRLRRVPQKGKKNGNSPPG
jgi:phosphoserine phosphatase RsbU/P